MTITRSGLLIITFLILILQDGRASERAVLRTSGVLWEFGSGSVVWVTL